MSATQVRAAVATWAALVVLTGAGSALGASCPSFSIGVTSFSDIQVRGVSCFRARTLLDQTTLSSVRRGRSAWSYAGFAWRSQAVGDLERTIVGTAGTRRVRARWATT